MCGIAGYFLHSRIDTKGFIDSALRSLHHRGPDAQGVFVDDNHSVALGHTRLSIVDLSATGNQPMHSLCGNYTIVYNGEIYNADDIRPVLESLGYRFRGSSDTEVLLNGYIHYGTDILEKLRGMFAFAIYSRKDNSLFCARDPMGKKPFVYATPASGFIFASELPVVRHFPGVSDSVNRSALATMLLHNLRAIPAPYTSYSEIYKLRAAHALIVKQGRIECVWQYRQPTPATCATTPACLRDILEDAVKRRMRADVPVGALLSGGVDSTAIVALMRRHANTPIRTYALGMNEDDEDIKRASRMAALLGTGHSSVYFDPQQQFEDFKEIIRCYGEPIALLPLTHTLVLCRAIAGDGIKVVLAGHGADELFYGYTGHVRMANLSALTWLCAPLGHLRNRFLPSVFRPKGLRKAAFYQRKEREYWPRLLAPEAMQYVQNLVSDELTYWGSQYPGEALIDESNWCGLMVENPPSITIAGDLPAMMASVEMRCPFLDKEMVAFALATHYRKKVPHWRNDRLLKYILKQAVADLMPHDILYASKRGFGMGIQESDILKTLWNKHVKDYIQDNLDDMGGLLNKKAIRDIANQEKLSGDDASLIMKVLSMQLWAADGKSLSL